MTITYKQGNAVDALINGEIDVLLHCVNCRGKFASGIAGEIRKKIPVAYDSYMDFYDSQQGDMFGKTCWGSGKVVHLAAQYDYGYSGTRFVNYGALASCLQSFQREATPYKNTLVKSVGIPYQMCCGLAGGDWNIVLEMVEYFLKDFNVIVYKLEGL